MVACYLDINTHHVEPNFVHIYYSVTHMYVCTCTRLVQQARHWDSTWSHPASTSVVYMYGYDNSFHTDARTVYIHTRTYTLGACQVHV